MDEARALLSDELEHRVKNLLATVRSIASRPFQEKAMRPRWKPSHSASKPSARQTSF